MKIPEGMRAVSVRSNDVVGVAGFLYPGSHVDVLVTSKVENSPNPLTQTILPNVEVLVAGQKIEPDPRESLRRSTSSLCCSSRRMARNSSWPRRRGQSSLCFATVQIKTALKPSPWT